MTDNRKPNDGRTDAAPSDEVRTNSAPSDEGRTNPAPSDEGRTNPAPSDEGRTNSAQSDAELHDMGGDIGPASIRGSEEPIGGRPDDDAAPTSGYSTSTRIGQEGVTPGTTGSELGTPAAHQSSNPTDVTSTPATALDEDAPADEYVSIDPDPGHGRGGADGEWEARLEQKRNGGP